MGNQTFNKYSQNQQLKRFSTRFGQFKAYPGKTLHKITQLSDGKPFLLKQIGTNDEIQKQNILTLIKKKIQSKSCYITLLEDYFLHMQNNYCSNQFKVFLIFDHIPKSLKDQIIDRRLHKNYFTQQDLLTVIEAVIYGLIDLNNMNHLYQQICSSKIMIDSYGYIRLSDPWLSQQNNSYKNKNNAYMSPQRLDLVNYKRMKKIDWLLQNLFVLGMITLEMLYLESMNDMIYTNNKKAINFMELNHKISNIPFQQVKRYAQMLLGNQDSRRILMNQFICKYPRNPNYLKKESETSNNYQINSSQFRYLPSSSTSNLMTSVVSKPTTIYNSNIFYQNQQKNSKKTLEKVLNINHSSKILSGQSAKIPQTRIFYTNKKQSSNFVNSLDRTINQKENIFTNNLINPLRNNKISYQIKNNNNPFVKIRVVNEFNNMQNINLSHSSHSNHSRKPSIQNNKIYTNPGMGQIYIPNLKFNQYNSHQGGKNSFQTGRSFSTNYLDNFEKMQTQIKQNTMQNCQKHQQQVWVPIFSAQKLENIIQGRKNQSQSQNILNEAQRIDYYNIHTQHQISAQQSNQKQQQQNMNPIEQQIKIQYNNTDPDEQNELYLLSYDQNYKLINQQQYQIKVHQVQSNQHTPQRKSVINLNKYNSTIQQVSQTDQSPNQTNDDTQYVIEQYGQGSKYQGQKKRNMKNGYGTFVYKDGGYYQGEWKDDRMHGLGKLYYNNNKLAYQGNWFMDEFHGFGKVYNDMPQQLDSLFDYYNFDNIQQFWQYYEGNLISDVKQGLGKLKLSNGEIFQGEFKKDRIDGTGRFFTKKGEIINGIWENSKLITLL